MTCRHFGNPTRGLIPVTRQPALAPGATLNTGAEIIPFLPARRLPGPRRTTGEPSGSSLSSRHWLAQLAIDLIAVTFTGLFILSVALSVPLAILMLVFGAY